MKQFNGKIMAMLLPQHLLFGKGMGGGKENNSCGFSYGFGFLFNLKF